MTHVHSFPAISTPRCHTLILGSMPGKASLVAGQYYAHPRNSFWRIIGKLLDMDPMLSYQRRVEAVTGRGIAVWDVMKTCTRTSSLDADIVESSIVPNDFDSFFATHLRIASVYFNGAKAEHAYRKYVLSRLPLQSKLRTHTRLPSTSPANASLDLDAKFEAWKSILQ